MSMFKYILKRIGLMIFTFMIIMTIDFVLIRSLQVGVEPMMGVDPQAEAARREALGYNKPIPTQYYIYLRNIVTNFDWGTSWKIDYRANAEDVLFQRLPPTLILNSYSFVFSVPLGIALGIWAAIKKNKLTDHIISTTVMIFVSVPSYVYAFLLQYTLGFKLGLFPVILSSLYDAGGSWTSMAMLRSMVLPILSLSFGSIALLARFTRAELTEALTSEYMLLARAKGLTRAKAITRHALRNAMVPILPMLLSMFIGLIGGSLVIENIFAINGVGRLTIRSIFPPDYDVFMICSVFYTSIGLASMILIDLSYGFLDPRIRMGER